jgi:UPF0716 family protein affecting phage T7 exclusion
MKKPVLTRIKNTGIVGISVLTGCLGLIVVLAALLLGLWLANQLGQRWIVALVVALSAPLSLFLMTWLGLTLAKRLPKPPQTGSKYDDEEDIS